MAIYRYCKYILHTPTPILTIGTTEYQYGGHTGTGDTAMMPCHGREWFVGSLLFLCCLNLLEYRYSSTGTKSAGLATRASLFAMVCSRDKEKPSPLVARLSVLLLGLSKLSLHVPDLPSTFGLEHTSAYSSTCTCRSLVY